MAKNRQEPKALTLAPHAVARKATVEGFELSFTGLQGKHLRRVTLQFPLWWVTPLTAELKLILDAKQSEIDKLRDIFKEMPS